MSSSERSEPFPTRDQADPRPGPLALVINLERSGLVRAAFAMLSPAQAHVLSCLEGLDGPPETVNRLAHRMRCSASVILSLQASAIAALTAALRDDVAPD